MALHINITSGLKKIQHSLKHSGNVLTASQNQTLKSIVLFLVFLAAVMSEKGKKNTICFNGKRWFSEKYYVILLYFLFPQDLKKILLTKSREA